MLITLMFLNKVFISSRRRNKRLSITNNLEQVYTLEPVNYHFLLRTRACGRWETKVLES